jgi:hypothetical protein
MRKFSWNLAHDNSFPLSRHLEIREGRDTIRREDNCSDILTDEERMTGENRS